MRRLAVYPGSFDPPTLGHLDVIERAAQLFEELVVAVGTNPAKDPFLSVEARVEGLRLCTQGMSNVKAAAFPGLLADFVQSLGADAIVRGLRTSADFEFEFHMATANRNLVHDLETVFLMSRPEHSYLSSSIVREVATLGGDYSAMVPKQMRPIIAQAISARNGQPPR